MGAFGHRVMGDHGSRWAVEAIILKYPKASIKPSLGCVNKLAYPSYLMAIQAGACMERQGLIKRGQYLTSYICMVCGSHHGAHQAAATLLVENYFQDCVRILLTLGAPYGILVSEGETMTNFKQMSEAEQVAALMQDSRDRLLQDCRAMGLTAHKIADKEQLCKMMVKRLRRIHAGV